MRENIRVVTTKKELHGWWNGIEPDGLRECTSERLLINPYNGCAHDCFFCYAHAFPGHFAHFRKTGVITVFKDFDRVVAAQLDRLRVASCGYLSPVTDPFQPVNGRFHLTERIIAAFVTRNLPVDVVTKGVISDTTIRLLKQHSHAFAQVSILTLDEDKRRWMMRGGATTDDLFRNIERLSNEGIFTVCRVDPVLPYITSDELEPLISKAVEAGASHIVTSCMDIPKLMSREIYGKIEKRYGKDMRRRYEDLYVEVISGRLHARIDYRRRLFNRIREICNGTGVTMGLCMEFETVNGRYRGLNREFMTSNNCEGIDIPLYIRRDSGYEPVPGCDGNCLNCYFSVKEPPVCGIPDLRHAGAWKLRDYKRWSRTLGVNTVWQK